MWTIGICTSAACDREKAGGGRPKRGRPPPLSRFFRETFRKFFCGFPKEIFAEHLQSTGARMIRLQREPVPKAQSKGGGNVEPSVNLKDAAQVEEAIGRARRYAQEQGVPLTMERVAACLGAGRKEIQAAIEQAQSCRGTGSPIAESGRKSAGGGFGRMPGGTDGTGAFPVQQPGDADLRTENEFRLHRPPTEEPSFETVRFEGEDEIPE